MTPAIKVDKEVQAKNAAANHEVVFVYGKHTIGRKQVSASGIVQRNIRNLRPSLV